ncbi:MAG: TetR/AcrR family transcriptional regulator [Pseudomonadota bacterium]
MKRQRLSPEVWIKAGLSELVTAGPNALAAESLARKIGTTKGSFYWHFRDVPDFQAAVVKHWQNQAFTDVLQALEDSGTAEHRLRRFGRDVLARPHDPAMRAWALSDKSVAKAIAQVDAERLKYLVNVLKQLGVSNDGFAQSCLGALVGLPAVTKRKQAIQSFDTLLDLILALK